MLPDSQSMLSTDRPCLPSCALISVPLQPRLSRFCVPFAFLPLVPYHPPLSNPLIIFTTAAPTPHSATAALWVSHPRGALHTFPECVP